MAQWVKAFATKAEFDRRAKMVEGENQLSSVVLWPAHMTCDMHTFDPHSP